MFSFTENFTNQVGDGTTVSFPFNAFFKERGDVVVFVIENNIPQLKTLGIHYDVVTSKSVGGDVVFYDPPASGVVIHIFNKPDIAQVYSPSRSGVLPNALESALDNFVSMVQYVRYLVGRTITLPEGEWDESALKLPSLVERAGKYLGFDVDGRMTTSSVLPTSAQDYASGVSYDASQYFRNASNGNVYVAIKAFTASGDIANEVNTGNARLFLDTAQLSLTYATLLEALAGVETTVAMSPYLTKQAIKLGDASNFEIVNGAQKQIVVGTTYRSDNASLQDFLLPASASIGDRFRVQGLGTGKFQVKQNAGQQCLFGSTITNLGTGNGVKSTNPYDLFEFECISPNTLFKVSGDVQYILTI